MTAAVREVLGHVDAVVTDNAAPLRSLITNLAAFADALGRNSTHVDGIVAGLERLTGGGAKGDAGGVRARRGAHLPRLREAGQRLSSPCASRPRSMRCHRTGSSCAGRRGLTSIADDAKWSDLLPLVLQARMLQSFENAGLMRQASRPLDGLNADFQLVTEIRKFDLVAGA